MVKNEIIYQLYYKQRFSFGHSSYFTTTIKSYPDEIVEVAKNLYNDTDILVDLIEIKEVELRINAEPKMIKFVPIKDMES